MSDIGAQLQVESMTNGWRLNGELDAHTATSLSQALNELPAGDVIIDLAEVSFVDSSGLRVLLDATNRARAAGGDLVIFRPQASIRRLIEISGLKDHVRVQE